MPERSILAWLAIGLAVGVIGKIVLPGRDSGGTVFTVLIGIGGALTAGFVAETMRWTASGTWQNLVALMLGAGATIALYRLSRHRRA